MHDVFFFSSALRTCLNDYSRSLHGRFQLDPALSTELVCLVRVPCGPVFDDGLFAVAEESL